jgi:hypothetical protein
MSTKNQVLKLIDEFSGPIINDLQIGHCSIKWHVYHSKDKELKKKGFECNGSCVAITVWNSKKKRNKTYDIVIYYDLQKGRKDTIGSIFHELMHIRMRQWDRLIKKTKYSTKRHNVIEEKLVRDMEKVFLDLI